MISRLFDLVRRKPEPELVCWQDGYQRSFEPMQVTNRPQKYQPRDNSMIINLLSTGLSLATVAAFAAAIILENQAESTVTRDENPIASAPETLTPILK